ncbi:MAG: hypothetical protein IJC62_02775 [Clostridia bacterium]|nr:hypothetical protein [Clostridia bacterium]
MTNEYFALVSCEISPCELAALSSEVEVIKLPADGAVDKPVRAHPDMILCIIGDTLITHRAYYNAHIGILDRVASLGGLNVVTSDHPRGKDYPADVGFNAAVTSTHIICNTKTVAPEVLDTAQNQGLTVVHVNQGYTACSCIVTDDSVITSDVGIHASLTEHGIPVSLASNRGISLPGYDVGFVGGAGGYCDGTLYFYGDIREMECERDIRCIAEEYGYGIKCLSFPTLPDRGGIKFIRYAKR